jgi:Polyketide cyclase / dehydrase and lipid transport
MNWLVVIGAVAALAATVYSGLLLLPATRTGHASIELSSSPEQIIAVLRDVESQPEWRSDVAKIDLTTDGWVETTQRGEAISFRWVSISSELVELAFASATGYSGSWIARLSLTGTGTRMDVTETATIPNPFFRAVARLFFDPAAFSRTYLNSLKRRLES